MREKHLKEYLSQLFMSYSGKPEDTSKEDNYSRRMEMVNKYLGMYYDDRRMQRSVLIIQEFRQFSILICRHYDCYNELNENII